MLTAKLSSLVESFSDLDIEEQEAIADEVNILLSNTPYEDIHCESVSQDKEHKITYMEFSDTSSGDSVTLAFFVDEDGLPVVCFAEDIDDGDDEITVMDLIELEPTIENGMIVFNDMSWFDIAIIEFMFAGEPEKPEEIQEAFLTVIRGGKKVKKKIIRKKRKKRLSAKRRMGIRKAVRLRRLKKAQTQRKRARSLKLRARSRLKNKPKGQRVVG